MEMSVGSTELGAGSRGSGMSVTLGEGNTPLLPAPRLSEQLGCELWLKWEGANPTGSFKDRGMTVAVSRALERGAPGVVCASTGNTAASAAAYAARAGLPAVIVIPKGAVARGKLAQVLAAGADLREVEGTFEEAHALARRLADEEGWVNVNSINPDRIEGQASAAREIVDQLGGPPDVLALPYGGGGNTLAYARGFDEAGAGRPRLLSVQADRRPETVATAIRISQPVHREQAEAVTEVVTVADDGAASSGGARSAASKGSSASPPRPQASPASRSFAPAGASSAC